jgi:phage gp36-like protein
MYAARADLVKRFGEQEIASLEDPDNTGAPSAAVSQEALEDATEEVNSYVAVRYGLPLPSVPAPLSRAVCDVARFRLYKDRPTEEVKYRYERTVKWLEQLAAGKVLLTFDPALTPAQTEELTKPATPVSAHYSGGAFSDDTLGKMVDPAKVDGWGVSLR